MNCNLILSRFRGVTIDGVWIGKWFIDHLFTRLGTTSTYSATADYTLYKSLEYMLSLFGLLSLVVSW
jgi:hypothetical protein